MANTTNSIIKQKQKFNEYKVKFTLKSGKVQIHLSGIANLTDSMIKQKALSKWRRRNEVILVKISID